MNGEGLSLPDLFKGLSNTQTERNNSINPRLNESSITNITDAKRKIKNDKFNLSRGFRNTSDTLFSQKGIAKNPKDIRSDLHNKTHFKAAQTFQLLKPIAFKDRIITN